jgi:hypothetical protein
MARAHLGGTFAKQLSLEDVQALGPVLLEAVKIRCPADTMFGADIRMGAFKALAKYHFQEGIEAGVIFAKDQGGWGSENRTGQIMQDIMSYGSAAREAVPGLKELIVEMNVQTDRNEFPRDLNRRRVGDVQKAIQAIEAAKTQPTLRHITTEQVLP